MPLRFANARFTKDGIVHQSVGADETAKPGNAAISEYASAGGNATLKAWEVVDGIVRFTGTTAGVTLTTPTATAILAYHPGAAVKSTFHFGIANDSTQTVTLGAGTGVTNSGTGTAATGVYRLWVGTWTNVTDTPAFTLTDA